MRRGGAGRGHHQLRHGRRLRGDPRRGGAGAGPVRRAPGVGGDLHQGVLADRLRAERPWPVAQAHHRVGERVTAPAAAPTTSICTRRTGTTTRHRWKRRCAPSRTWSGRAKRCTSGCRSGGPRRSRRRCGSPARCTSTGSCPTSRSTTCCGGSSSPRSSRCARRRASGRSSSPRSRRACSPASTGPVSSRRRVRAPPTSPAAPASSAAGCRTRCWPRCRSCGRSRRRPGCRWRSSRWPGPCRTRTCPRRSSGPPARSRSGRT